jgi:hypothetical protein
MTVIIVARLHAMYQRSRKILVLLIVTLILVLLIVTLILVQISSVVVIPLWQETSVLAGKLR